MPKTRTPANAENPPLREQADPVPDSGAETRPLSGPENTSSSALAVEPEPEPLTYAEARAALTALKAQREKLALQLQAGLLIDRAEADRQRSAALERARDRMLAAALALAPRLARLDDAREIALLLRRELRAAHEDETATAPPDRGELEDRILLARAAKAEAAAELLRRRLAAQAGIYVLADEVRAEFGRQLSELMATIERRLPDLVTALGAGRDGGAIAKKWWRDLRQAESDRAAAGAAAQPRHKSNAAAETRT